MAEIANSTTQWPKDKMESYSWLDELLMEQTATEKEFQAAWQAYKYLLRGKMYAYIGINDQNGRPIITLKLDPAFSDLLRREYADIVPGYYMNKQHWSSAYLDSDLPREVLTDLVCAAHKTILSSLSKKAQREILGE